MDPESTPTVHSGKLAAVQPHTLADKLRNWQAASCGTGRGVRTRARIHVMEPESILVVCSGQLAAVQLRKLAAKLRNQQTTSCATATKMKKACVTATAQLVP